MYTRHLNANEPPPMNQKSSDSGVADEARRMMLVDVYQIGRVLKRKYQLLRFSYSFLALSALLSAMLFVYKTLDS